MVYPPHDEVKHKLPLNTTDRELNSFKKNKQLLNQAEETYAKSLLANYKLPKTNIDAVIDAVGLEFLDEFQRVAKVGLGIMNF